MGISNLFKKREPEIQTIEVEKIVEKEVKVEVPVTSRLTFAHNDDIGAAKFIFNDTRDTKAIDLTAGERFIFFGHDEGGKIAYPVFQMPNRIASTRMTSPSRIICVGMVGVAPDNTVLEVNSLYAGLTMAELASGFGCESINANSMVTLLNYGSTFTDKEIEGDITYQAFCNFIEISHNIYWLKHPMGRKF